ncbi:MAG: amino acid carrier protein [Myxococcota bacterium]|nr:amino acid carrier protein [Myxococcota bacterium]
MSLEEWLGAVSGFIWGPLLLIPLLVGTGFYLSVILRGLQFRVLPGALRIALIERSEADAEGDISHFQALMTALAATVGTGNIAGVATAIAAGGPGALFWMWITGLVGMATKYSEALLSVRYRQTDRHGRMAGGPMYFLSSALPQRRLGRLLGGGFAVFAALAAFGIGNGVQSQEVGNAIQAAFGVTPMLTHVVLAALVVAVTIGGIRSIGRVAGALVPVMIVLYLAAACLILVLNLRWIPQAFVSVFEGAFGAEAFGGGLLGASIGAAVRFGVARGIFSNESGLGSAGIAAAAASTREPVRQAMVSMTQTFIDTLVICTLTGLVILTTILRDVDRTRELPAAELTPAVAFLEGAARDGSFDPLDPKSSSAKGALPPEILAAAPVARWKVLRGSQWTTLAFREGLPGAGGAVVALALALFALTTIIGWSYYGEKSVQYLLGDWVVLPYRLLFASMVIVGPLLFGQAVWLVSDIMNGLMALPNLIGLLLLSPIIVAETRAYFERARAGTGSEPGPPLRDR